MTQIITIRVRDDEGAHFRVDFERDLEGPLEDLVRHAAAEIIHEIQAAGL